MAEKKSFRDVVGLPPNPFDRPQSPAPGKIEASPTPTGGAGGGFSTSMQGGQMRYMAGGQEVSAEQWRNMADLYKDPGITQQGQQQLGQQGIDPFATQMQQEVTRQQLAQQSKETSEAIGQEDFRKLGIADEGFISRLKEGWEDASTLQKASIAVPLGIAAVAGGFAIAGAALAGTGVAAAAKVGVAAKVSSFFGAKTALSGTLKAMVLVQAAGLVSNLSEQKKRDIESQMNDVVTESTDLARQINNGLDPIFVRDELKSLEEEVRDLIGQYNQARKFSIRDRMLGIDIQTKARKDLRKINNRMALVDNYIATGDIQQLNQQLGVFDPEQ